MKELHVPLGRSASVSVAEALRRFPVVILTGARQTGKTTLITALPVAGGRTYRTLDDYGVLERAERQPDSLLEDAPRMTLDEVQRAPGLLLAIKRDVDRKRTAGRFLLTGSANLLMMRRVSESLAGRATYLHLWPFTEAERAGRPGHGPWPGLMGARDAREARGLIKAGPPARDWSRPILSGGYPVPALMKSQADRAAWFDGYVRTYLERDLQEVSAIDALSDFRRLLSLAALRVGKVVNQADLARDAGLSPATAHRYLNLLEVTFQVVRIPPYAVSRTKRLVKSPKLYWSDTGLAAHLAGAKTAADLSALNLLGPLLENLLLVQWLAWRDADPARPEILHWRTQAGQEVDFVLESGSRLLPVEVKAGRRADLSDVRSLELFLEEHRGRAPFGLLVHGGNEVLSLTERVLAVPAASVMGQE